MESPVTPILKEFGLEPKEIAIYLAVLRLGKATISEIARESKVKRTTIYEYADRLTKENLFHKTAKGRQVLYVAENPTKLAKILDRKHKKLVFIMPELQKIYAASTHKPRMRYYEGIEGLRSIYAEMTNTSQVIYSIFSTEKFLSLFSEKDADQFLNNLYEQGGQIKDLVEKNPVAKKYTEHALYKKIGKAKTLPEHFDVPVDLMVAGDKVSMISYENLVGVIIENPEIAELQRVMIKFIRRSV